MALPMFLWPYIQIIERRKQKKFYKYSKLLKTHYPKATELCFCWNTMKQKR